MKALQNFLHTLGLGDGEGNISMGRVIALLTTLTALFPQVKAAIESSGADLTQANWKLLLIGIASHQLTKFQEKYQPVQVAKDAIQTAQATAQQAVKTAADAASAEVDSLVSRLKALGVNVEVNQQA
jgi:hypothetical protein